MYKWIKGRLSNLTLLLVFIISFSGLYLLETYRYKEKHETFEEQIQAARLMYSAIQEIRKYRIISGIKINKEVDPNETGLIGEEFTPLTTTLGNLEAKRTTTNPAFAPMLVRFLHQAGLKKGDIVAIGASGSFPALILATLSAVKVLELEPILIYSIGSSMYGANLPEFTFLQMLKVLNNASLIPYRISAISMGGDGDRAEGMFYSDSYRMINNIALSSGVTFITEENLAESISKRMEIYKANSGGRVISCFINIGGASTNYGNTYASLSFPNGLVLRTPDVPDSEERGLIFEFSSKGIPVINLLNIRELAVKHGLPIDPVPLPAVGTGDIYYQIKYNKFIGIFTIIILILIIFIDFNYYYKPNE